MKKILYLLSISFLMLQSCSSESDNSNDSVLEGKLKKIITTENGNNTNVQNFEYDTNGRLI